MSKKIKKNKAAFFDFDLTITNYDSFKSFLKFFYFKRIDLLIYYLPLFVGIIILKKIRLINLKTAKKYFLIGLKGLSKEEINKIAYKYLESYYKSLINDNAVKIIKKLEKDGFLIFLISSSPNILFSAIKEKLNFVEILSLELKYKNNVFIGELSENDCFGMDKKYIIKNLAKKYNIDLSMSFSFTDHISDLPMLDIVGYPVVINPKRRLKKIAESKKFRIEFW